jgi:integrase
MVRKSYQKGYVDSRKTEEGKVHYLRYRLRDSKGKWAEKTEMLPSFESPKKLKEYVAKRMDEVNDYNNNPRLQPIESNKSLTVAEFRNTLWKSYVQNKKYKPSTHYSYENLLDKYVEPVIGSSRLKYLGPRDMTDLLDRARGTGIGDKTLLNLYRLLCRFFSVAVAYGEMAKAPLVAELHRPSWSAKEKPVLEPEQIAKVLANIPDKHIPVCAVIAILGLRIGEALAIKWDRVDLDKRILTVDQAFSRGVLTTPKTKASFRRIYIPEPLVTILSWHRQHSVFTEGDDFVFCGQDGSALNHDSLRRTVLYKAMDRAGIQREKFNHGFHIFRHSAITMLYRLTGDLKRAQGFARHSRISTTADTYVHSDPVESESTEMVAANITSADLLNERGICGTPVVQTSDLIQ